MIGLDECSRISRQNPAAVLFRHHNVQKNQIRLVHAEGGYAFYTVRRGFDLVALLLQIHPQKVAYVFVVVDDQYFRNHIVYSSI